MVGVEEIVDDAGLAPSSRRGLINPPAGFAPPFRRSPPASTLLARSDATSALP